MDHIGNGGVFQCRSAHKSKGGQGLLSWNSCFFKNFFRLNRQSLLILKVVKTFLKIFAFP